MQFTGACMTIYTTRHIIMSVSDIIKPKAIALICTTLMCKGYRMNVVPEGALCITSWLSEGKFSDLKLTAEFNNLCLYSVTSV